MTESKVRPSGGITLLGLGPGDSRLLTREAWDWMKEIDVLYLRTKMHPTVSSLPEHLKIISFDDIYKAEESFEAVYSAIVEEILELGKAPKGVTYAVPGHPFVAEATCPDIAKQAKEEGITLRVIDGLSFLEPTIRVLGMDLFPNLVLVDALALSMRQTPGFPPSSPALVAQIYSKAVASQVKLTLMAAYPDEHPVKLVHGAGTTEENVEELPLYAIDQGERLGLLSSLYIPPLSQNTSFESFQEVVARLRAPDGCPWDREQTHTSLRPYLLEEAYETLDALDRDDMKDLQEELGDLLLQILLHAQIASEMGDFNIHHVLHGIGSKLIRRHPHVFSDVQVEDVSGVIQTWEAIKAEERQENGEPDKQGLLDGVPQALPALLQAEEIIERVRRVDFTLLDEMGNKETIRKLLNQVKDIETDQQIEVFGELLLAITSLAHNLDISAETALRETLARYRAQFGNMEAQMLAKGQSLAALSQKEKEDLWATVSSDESQVKGA